MAKVTFDGPNKLIIVNTGVTSIDVETDLYTAWKQWVLTGGGSIYAAAFRIVGGDVIGTNQYVPTYYFLINNWKVKVENLSVNFSSNLYSDDYLNPFNITNSSVYVQNSDVPDISNITNSLTAITYDVTHILGLVQHNFRFSGQTYNSDGNLISGIISIYSSAVACELGTSPISTYNISAEYDSNDRLIDYKVKLV